MPEQRTFTGVTPATWARMQMFGRDRHGTAFQAIDANRGQATTETPFGRLVLDYALDPASESITYTIVSKPLFVMSPMLWVGIEAAIKGCRDEA
jgi:hypothetical protein